MRRRNCRLPIADGRLAVARRRGGLFHQDPKPQDASAPGIHFNRQSAIENRKFGFTLIEVLTVMTVILVLAGITIGTYSYVNNRGARARAEGEIAALGAACENYKLDNGDYPSATSSTASQLDARTAVNLTLYQAASKELYEALRGSGTAKSYFSFRPVMLGKSGSGQPAAGHWSGGLHPRPMGKPLRLLDRPAV